MRREFGKNDPFKFILSKQQAWAMNNPISLDGSRNNAYVKELKDNLFPPRISQDLVKEFSTGGHEMKKHMLALHSSSALAVNFFETWRTDPGLLDILANSLFNESGFQSIHFETSYPTGLLGTAPHLDIFLTGENAKPVAIEAKYTEPYSKVISRPKIAKSYFKEALWAGLPKSYSLLTRIHEGELVFQRLDAVQLLKHTLGLSKHFMAGFRLFLLWYDFPSEVASKMEKEIEVFINETRDEIDFQSLSYQEAFLCLHEHRSVCPDYFAYMQERYFMTD